MRIYTYFGWVQAVAATQHVQVCIADNLSGKRVEFSLPSKSDAVQLCATEQHVLILLDESDEDVAIGKLWLYKMRTERLFKLQLPPNRSPFDLPFHAASEVAIKIEPHPAEQPTTTAQFSHWHHLMGPPREWQEIGEEGGGTGHGQKLQLACTAFSAFLAINLNSGPKYSWAILHCLYRREDPHLCDEPSCSSLPSSSCTRKETTKFSIQLEFHVKKICAGHDHLALLDTCGSVHTLGTGTKGELGHGRVEQGQWKEPKRIEAFTEAGIRIVDLACGAWHTVALTDESDLYGWGWNGHGQLGTSPDVHTIQPVPFPFELPDEEEESKQSNNNKIAIHCAGNRTFVRLPGNNGRILVFGEDSNSDGLEEEQKQPMASTSSTQPATATEDAQKPEDLIVEQSAEEQPESHAESAAAEPPEPKRPRQQRMLRLAVAGCSHGQMDTIYERLAQEEQRRQVPFDLLICCGDFQAIRNHGDLHHYHAPPHHRKLGTFHKYYSGEKLAPVLTLFIGGNHESSGYMAELPMGGWVAPNIYYMGYASVLQFAGLRIAGLSGIYKPNDYNLGHFEHPPFHRGSVVSAYHVRSLEIYRLRQLQDSKLDICFTHDWPAGITDFGDVQWLLRVKPFFAEDVHFNRLGNPATMDLLHTLKPSHWFSAHLHVRFTAVVPHAAMGEASPESAVTRFLALDKPMQQDSRRRFLEFMELPIGEDAPMELRYDPHWLAILRATDQLTECTDRRVQMPNEPIPPTTLAQELATVHQAFGADQFRVPLNFQRTAPPELEPWNGRGRPASKYYRNPQSQQFCERLGIRDLNLLFAQACGLANLDIPHCIREADEALAAKSAQQANGGGQAEGAEVEMGMPSASGEVTAAAAKNPEEIDLDEFGDDDFVEDVTGSSM